MQTTLELSDIRPRYDIVVIGGGPAGCATAAAFADRGANVLVVESNPNAARRFAGEWIHPEGARVLESLGLLNGLETRVAGRGFMVFPNDGFGPIRLEYGARNKGFACEHEGLVAHLRRGVSSRERVDYAEGIRASRLDGTSVTLSARGALRVIGAPLTVVATGRSAHKLVAEESTATKVSISLMAGLVVRDTELPFEEFGHVIAGGPGPALAYRIGKDRVRLCVDVPHDEKRARDPKWIWRSFADVLPSPLREGVERSLGETSLHWAANSFRPRRYKTGRGVALVGDAAGVFHPLTAMGITMSLLDAEALSESRSLAVYAERRASETYVPELLSNAIYQAFARDDAGTLAIRDAIFRTWRSSATQRDRTMDLLGAATTRRADFVRAFSHVAVRAGAEVLFSDRKSVRELAGWLRWPWASVHPHRNAMRARSVTWASPQSWRGNRQDETATRIEGVEHVS